MLKPLARTLLAFTTVVCMGAGDAHAQKTPLELEWRTESTVRRSLVVTPIGLKVDSSGAPSHWIDISSVGSGDTATAALSNGLGWFEAGTEYFSSLRGTRGVLTVALARMGARSSTLAADYTTLQSGARFGVLRALVSEGGVDPPALRVLTGSAFSATGYSGNIRLRVVPHARVVDSTGMVHTRLTAHGGVTLISDRPLVRVFRIVNGEVAEEVSFAIPVGARGMIEAEVTVAGALHGAGYQASTIYLLAGRNRLYSGTTGFAELEIAQLHDRRSSGEVRASEYDRQLHDILSRGSRSTINVEHNP